MTVLVESGTQIRSSFDEMLWKGVEIACSYFAQPGGGLRTGAPTADDPTTEGFERLEPLEASKREAFMARIDRLIAALDAETVGTTAAPTLPRLTQLATFDTGYESDTWLPVARKIHYVTGSVVRIEKRPALHFDSD